MMKPAWNVCARTDSPNAAAPSQSPSPIHIAARNGMTARGPLASTRATRAAMLGPGVPALINKAPAKISKVVMSITDVLRASCHGLASDIRRHRIGDETFFMRPVMQLLHGFGARLLVAGKNDLRPEHHFHHGKLPL